MGSAPSPNNTRLAIKWSTIYWCLMQDGKVGPRDPGPIQRQP